MGGDRGEIRALNKGLAVATTDAGEHLPITDWLDADGDDCEPERAVVAVAGPDARGGWHVLRLWLFGQVQIH